MVSVPFVTHLADEGYRINPRLPFNPVYVEPFDICFGDAPRWRHDRFERHDRPAMPGNDNFLAGKGAVDQLGKMGLGFGDA